MRNFYAAINRETYIDEGFSGPRESWTISRFKSRAGRAAFVKTHENKGAKYVTRREAIQIFRDTFGCADEPVPPGGLFGPFGFAGI